MAKLADYKDSFSLTSSVARNQHRNKVARLTRERTFTRTRMRVRQYCARRVAQGAFSCVLHSVGFEPEPNGFKMEHSFLGGIRKARLLLPPCFQLLGPQWVGSVTPRDRSKMDIEWQSGFSS